MSITVDAIYENGILRPMQPLDLTDQERVRVTVELASHTPATSKSSSVRPSLAQRIAERARTLPPGALDSLPDDLATEHDHYLYGTSKRSE